MTIDSLTHVTPDGKWFKTNYDCSESRLLREIDASRIDYAVVVPIAGFHPNEFVLEVCNRRPDVLIPGCSFNPCIYPTPAEAVAEFRRQLSGTPYRVLKLHPRLNQYDPLDSRCLAMLEDLESWAKPFVVWLDTILYNPGVTLQKSLVDTLHEIVRRFPRLQFVLLHGGSSWLMQVAEAVRALPNAILDISFTMLKHAASSLTQDMRHLIATFDQRMSVGSDFPEFEIQTALDTFNRITEGLPEEKRSNVRGANLARVLQLY
jgi:predicted TIM-barrel fold metal-dependent hydrolase